MSFYQPANFVPDRSIGYLMRVINQDVVARIEPAIVALGLTYIQWQVLVSLYFDRGVTCAALARDLSHDKGAMTRLLDGLEERGLVSRERDTIDRRLVNLTITATGRKVAEQARDEYIAHWNQWLDGWKPGEVETLIAMLQRLRTGIDAAPEARA